MTKKLKEVCETIISPVFSDLEESERSIDIDNFLNGKKKPTKKVLNKILTRIKLFKQSIEELEKLV